MSDSASKPQTAPLTHAVINSMVSSEPHPAESAEEIVRLRHALRKSEEARERAESAQREAEERFRILMSKNTDATALLSAEGTLLYTGNVSRGVLGYQGEELLGISTLSLIHPEDRQAAAAEMQQLVQEPGATRRGEFRMLHRDGSWHWVEVTATNLLDEPLVRGLVVNYRDINERKQIESALRQSEERLDTLIRTVPGVVWEAWGQPDTDTQRINFVSDYVETMLGYTVEEWLAEPNFWLKIVHPEDRQQAAQVAADAFASGRTHTNTFRWITKEDKVVWTEAHSIIIRNDSGAPVGMRGVNIDITERTQAAEKLAKHFDEIQGLNVRLQRAMAETHHRIKNNLQTVLALIELLTENKKEMVPVSSVKRIGRHVFTLANIHDLLTHKAITDGDAQEFDIMEVFESLLPELERASGTRRLSHRFAELSLPVREGASLALLVNELVNNAVKHGTGDIEVYLTSTDGTGQLLVRDHGPGFPADFDPRRSANTGLELTHSLATWDLRGEITFTNHPEGGAQVIVTFPLCASESKIA